MHDERTAPQRIRVTGLQEAQLPALVALEQACTAMYHAAGFDAAEVPARALPELIALTRRHDVRVAEADDEVAGYMAWRDEPPGVAYLEELSVHPDHQRRGIATRLLEELRERARELGMQQIVLRTRVKASWAQDFYRRAGFVPLGPDAPAKVRAWRSEREASGTPLTRPGEVVLWSAIAPKPAEEPDDDGEAGDEPSAG
ncbi:amino-acid acetyltransferase [Sorangium cellulosum]|uniref:Amino-acid acetyltransferase n=1 Tax=Sorangium cellulosum TaxID=56 RepID=A0A2L0EUF4_SORCE|nr:GNAT family N-acetyltransferase [Sorangium cellulosum]AUX42923.1 amino-acid acetyltransferase [Sorangium cellulosum]